MREPPGLREHRTKKPALLEEARRDRRKKIPPVQQELGVAPEDDQAFSRKLKAWIENNR